MRSPRRLSRWCTTRRGRPRSRKRCRTHSCQRPRITGHVDGVRLQNVERHNLEGLLVRRCKHYWRSHAGVISLPPPRCDDTPPVAGLQPRKSKGWHRRRQVIAHAALMREKLRRRHCADRVPADVFWAGCAAAVAEEAGQWVVATRLKTATEHVEIGHQCVLVISARSSSGSLVPTLFGGSVFRLDLRRDDTTVRGDALDLGVLLRLADFAAALILAAHDGLLAVNDASRA